MTTPDGSRRIEADGRVVRFIDVKADRELAVLRTSAPVTHLTLTGEGTRLILHHADLPARVWDIRDPEERRAEMVRAWAERAPATAYLDTLLAGPTPTDVLMDAVVNDASLTPLRRLVAAEMLLERVAEINRVADATFESIMRDAEKATDAWQRIDTVAIKAHIKAAAAALEPSDDLSPRAIQAVIAQAENWEYRPSEPTDKQRLTEAERVVELTREQLQTKVTELEEAGQQLQKQTDAAEWSAYTANLALAQAAMDAGNWPEARERLAQCPESKRGWEWRWLHEKAHTVIGEVRGAATYVSPDASRVIATDTRSLRIATPDGTAIGSPIVFESPISELAFAPDGSAFLVALASDSTWNREYRVFTREGHPVGAPDAPPIIGRSATISPDGQRLIAVVPTERGLATHLLDATGALIRSLASVPTEAYDTSWSGDGERVAIITPHRLDVFNRDGEPIASLDAPGDRLGKPALAPDGSRIAFVRVPGDAGQTPRTELWTMNDSTPSTLAIPSDFPQAVSFSPDSEFMYVRLWGQPTLYVTRNGVEIGRIASPDDMLSDPILSPDGSKFLLTTRTTVSIHAPDGSRIGAPIAHGSGWVDSACFAPDGESIHSTSYHRGTIEQRDLSGKLLSRVSIGTSLHDIACTPDGLVLAALLNDFSDIAVATVLLSPNAALSDRSFASSISEIGRLEADARNHTDQQRDTPSQAAAAEHAAIAPHAPHRITTPDGSRLVSADADRVVRFWDTASGLEAASFRMTGDVARLELSPDGEALTMRMADGSLRMLDARPASAHAGDIEAWNSQMPAALAIVEKLVESDAPTDDLMNAVLNDASLIPLRRMLAAELLTVRLSEIEYDARRALATITKDQTDKAVILAAAAALEPSDTLSPRAKEILLTLANDWEYRAPQLSAAERLAEEARKRRLAEADLAIRSVDDGASDAQAATDRAAVLNALRAYRELRVEHDEPRYQAILTALASVNTRDARYVWAESAMRAGDLSYALNLILEAPRDRLTPEPGQGADLNARDSVDRSWEQATPCELAVLAMIRLRIAASGPERIAQTREVDQRILGRAIDPDEAIESASTALSRARAIMSDPAALDEYGRTWSENSDAQALLKEAEELIGHETQDDRE